jgi:hypothetical protein
MAYQLRKAAQVWLLEVVQFAVETGPFSSCLFLLLFTGKFVQLTVVLVERKAERDMRLDRSDDGSKADKWRT